MQLRANLLVLVLLVNVVRGIQCFYCLNCTSLSDRRTMQKCSYKFTHCAAAQVTIQKKRASLFVCALSRTCTDHFTTDAFEEVDSCYICDRDYCNAFIDVPLQHTGSWAHTLQRSLIVGCYLLTIVFSFLVLK